MILDRNERAFLYSGISQNFKTAFDFMASNDLNSLPIGKTVIDGGEVFASVSEYDTKDIPGDFEAHKNYVDIQILLDGCERMDYCSLEETSETIPYNPEKDVMKIQANGRIDELHMTPGFFAVFFPLDAHRPNISDGKSSHNKKVVIKVKI